jgi:hypothetical protein
VGPSPLRRRARSLSDSIKAKTSGVPRGDLVKLFAAIKLAVLHFERFDETNLQMQYMQLNMEACGNDLMHFSPWPRPSSSVSCLRARLCQTRWRSESYSRV